MAIERVIRRRSHGFKPNLQETFHHDLAGQRAGERGILPGGEQREGEQRAGKARAQYGGEQFVGLRDVRNFVEPARVERGGAENQNGRIDEQRKSRAQPWNR